jgi:hypothetical protein
MPDVLMAKTDTIPDPELATKTKADVEPMGVIIEERDMLHPLISRKATRRARNKPDP